MNKDSLQVSSLQFQGKFILPKISAKAVKTKQLLNSIVSENAPIIEQLPFDVVITCKNPSRKAINPKFVFYTEKEGYNSLNVFYGKVSVEGKDENPKEKVKNFILTFNEQYNKYKNMKPKSPTEHIIYSIERGIYNLKSIFNDNTI